MKAICLLLCAGCLRAAAPVPGIRGFSEAQAADERELEAKALAIPDTKHIDEHMRRMSAEPHHAGSPASKRVAEYALAEFQKWGLDAHIEEFEAFMPYPANRLLEMVAPIKFKAKLQEPVIKEDPGSDSKNQLPTFNAYSGTGDVTAPVIYVNYGIPEDYEELLKQGIDPSGKIVIARYGKSWRGTKPKVAQEHGAIGCLIYSDPHEDGYFQGDVYPKGAYRPSQGVQRGSVMDMPVYVGDPLSPGWASEKGSKRLAVSDAKTIMKIPVLPISYADAQPLLANLGGPVAPEAWRGALPITYHMGPGPSVAHLKLDFNNATRPLYDVIVTIPGSVYPDQWVLYGNHHDAWVNGANDPLSGATALMETARALAVLQGQGWRPKRTIKLALWDGEEFGLLGSTEWGEKHAEELQRNAIAYFNSDTNGKGLLALGGSPSLQTFISEITRDLQDPASGERLSTKLAVPQTLGEDPAPPLKPDEVRFSALGAGSDFVVFLHHLGIASVNAGFSEGSGGVYHSIYDTYRWYSSFSDVGHAYGKALAQFTSTALVRLAEAAVLPFEFDSLVESVRRNLEDLKKNHIKDQLDLSAISTELDNISAASGRYETEYRKGGWTRSAPDVLKPLNDILFHTERSLTRENGLPGRPWYKHQIVAPGLYTGYSAKSLPGVRESAEAGRWSEASTAIKEVAACLGNLAAEINRAAAILANLNQRSERTTLRKSDAGANEASRDGQYQPVQVGKSNVSSNR